MIEIHWLVCGLIVAVAFLAGMAATFTLALYLSARADEAARKVASMPERYPQNVHEGARGNGQ